jgi:hypothetical protein
VSVWLWTAGSASGVSGSLEQAQEAAGTILTAGSAPSAQVESARLALSAALESAYQRTGQAWRARTTQSGRVHWEAVRDG